MGKDQVFKKNMRFIFKVLFAACLLFAVAPAAPVQAANRTQAEAVQWAQAQVGKAMDVDGYAGVQCVDLILAYYDYLGVPRSSGNGEAYAYNALPAGWQRLQGAVPQAGDILVYAGNSNNPAGHVAIFESERVHYHQNFGRLQEVQRVTYRYNGLDNPYWGVIRPDFSSGSGYLNFGDSFDAAIYRKDIWRTICADGYNVVLSAEEKFRADHHWHFERQGDGSYIITSLYNGLVLNVADAGKVSGTNVDLYNRWGNDNGAQKWYLFASNSVKDAQELAPKLNLGLRLDTAGGSTAGGTNIQLFTANYTAAQTFAVYILPYKVPKAVSLTGASEMKEGDSLQLSADFGDATVFKEVTWSSSDEGIISVDASGKVTAKKEGSAVVTVVSNYNDRLTASKEITVKGKPDVEPPVISNVTVVEKTDHKLVVEMDVSDDAGVKKVYAKWMIAVAPGFRECGIQAGAHPAEKVTWLTDTRVRMAFEIENTDDWREALAGEKQRIYINACDMAGNYTYKTYAEAQYIDWDLVMSPYVYMTPGEVKTCRELLGIDSERGYSAYHTLENPGEVLEIKDGVYTAVKPGKITLVYLNNKTGKIKSCIVIVKSKDGEEKPAQKITGTAAYMKSVGDQAFLLDARVENGDGTLSYASDNETAAAVSENGMVTIKGEGTAVITVTASETENYKETSLKVKIQVGEKSGSGETYPPADPDDPSGNDEVSDPGIVKVSSIKIRSPLSDKIAAGMKVKLSASTFPSDAADKGIRWTSSDPKAATVNASGIVTLKKNSGGKSVVITAAAADGGGAEARYKITSMKGVVKKVSVFGGKTVKAGKTLKLKAKVTASRQANKKLQWKSSNTKYAAVNSSGVVKTLKKGRGKNVKITAMATDGSGKRHTVTIKIR